MVYSPSSRLRVVSNGSAAPCPPVRIFADRPAARARRNRSRAAPSRPSSAVDGAASAGAGGSGGGVGGGGADGAENNPLMAFFLSSWVIDGPDRRAAGPFATD